MLLASVSDPLFGATEDGEIAGVLIDKWDHNADYTEWTLHVRDGIKFQDGTPLDGAAVAFNIDTCKYSPLTGARTRRSSRSPGRARTSPSSRLAAPGSPCPAPSPSASAPS